MRRFAAIMFTDIVGYTAIMGADEQKAFKLLGQNRRIHKKLIKKYGGKWLKEMGDGILASFQTASNAVLCAAEIQFQAKEQQIGLRIGLHAGEVVFEGRDVLGDGVNVASRLEMLANEGQICISGTIYNNIKNKSGFQTSYLGEKQLKNVADPVKVYQIQVDESNGREELMTLREKTSWNDKQKLAFGGLLVLVVAAIIGYFLVGRSNLAESSELDKSIAVLQFRNLSGEEENQYFAAGVMEAINNHLSGIQDLRVSTRTATGQYNNTDKTIQEIGDELEVTYILEGSVQKYEDQMRISARIIDVLNDKPIWTKQYTEPLQNIFDLMTRIALDVASELRISLTPKEESLLTSHATTDILAYELYMRGRLYYSNYVSMYDKEDLDLAEKMYKNALEIDSTFTLALVGMGEINNQRHHFFGVVSKYKEAYEDSILMYASKAISIDPNLADAYLLRGVYYENTNQIDLAIRDLNKAISINPNSSEAYLNLGRIWFGNKKDPMKVFRYLQAAQFYEKNGALLPHIYRQYGLLYMALEDFQSAEKYFRQAIQLVPGNPGWRRLISWLYWLKGEFEEVLIYEKTVGLNQKEGMGDMVLAFMGKYDEYLNNKKISDSYREKGLIETEDHGDINTAAILIKKGKINEGNKILNKLYQHTITLERPHHWELAEIYAVMGDHKKAMEQLLDFEKTNPFSPMFSFLPHYYIFDELHNDPVVLGILDRVAKRKSEIRSEIHRLGEQGTRNIFLLISPISWRA